MSIGTMSAWAERLVVVFLPAAAGRIADSVGLERQVVADG